MSQLGWILLGVLIVAISAVGRRWRRRVRSLLTDTQAIAAGQWPIPLPLPGDDLIGQLQTSVVRMAETLQRRLSATQAERAKLEAVLRGMSEGVLVLDENGTVVLTNGRAETLLGLPPGTAMAGRSLIEITRHPDLHDLVRQVMVAQRGERSLVREIALEGDSNRVLQVAATPLRGDGESGGTSILVLRDITESRRLELIRRDFVANVSHELRTPLAAIRGYSETLLEGALENPAEARRFLSIIERHAERLGRLVDDLLTLSDLELGRAELRRGPVHAQAVFEAVFEILHAKAARAGLVLEQDVAGDLELLDADSDRLEQALLNLVDNAVKYTRDGGRVKVSARSAAHLRVPANVSIDRRRSFTEIAVADTGIGIPSQDLPRLTERFYRVDKARSREMGGTGLGLAIVKHIVHAHGGWMEIESELNRGTTVRLFLPNALRDEAIEVGQGASVASAPKRGST